jgi:release factor glutamine methyltransferase
LPEAATVTEGPPVTVAQAVVMGARRLAQAGCDTPRLDAEVLLGSVLGVGRERLVLDALSNLDAAVLARYQTLLARREKREPVAYITGLREFRQITLHVDPRVLIPRPETELLVEVGLGLAPGARVIDLGTGSGAVALGLKDERPDLTVVGVDVDGNALAVAAGNALRLGLDVGFVQADLLGDGTLAAGFDAVLANLPYVPSEAPVAPEIRCYEPAGALFAGPDGLDVIRRLMTMVGSVPLVALEIGPEQANAVASLVAGAGFGSIDLLRDLAGHDRVVVGWR